MAEPARIALVTGASAGIGLQTAIGLARAGFRVIVAGRDAARTDHARRLVAERSGSDAVETVIADFADLGAVRGLADTVLSRHERLDVLVNNAGLIARNYQLAQCGREMTFAVNHLAPFLLTNLLLDRLRASALPNTPARVVTVASQAHRGARLNLQTIDEQRDWTPLRAYSRSKLCNILFTRTLARRLANSDVMTASLHPGVVATKIADRAGGVVGWGWRTVKPFFITAEKGADTSIFLATSADPARFHGAYVIGRRIAQPDRAALSDDLAERLWRESERLTGL
jgi:retinol dehydrogenase 12